MSVNDSEAGDEISLFDPRTLVDKNKNQKIKQENPKLNMNLDKNKNRQELFKIENKIDKTSVNDKIIENKITLASNVNKNSNSSKSETKIISKMDKNFDVGYYGNGKDQDTKISKEENTKKKFVDIVIDKTEKILFDQKSLNLDSIIQNNIKPESNSNEINTSNTLDVKVNLNEPFIPKESKKNNSTQSFNGNSSEKKETRHKLNESNLEIEIGKTNISSNQPEVKKYELNKVKIPSHKVPKSLILSNNNNDLVPLSTKQVGDLIDNNIKENKNIAEKAIKPNFNENRATTNFEDERSTRFLTQKLYILDVKNKIEKINLGNQEILNNIENNNVELSRQFDELQNEKQEKLKEYREMLVKMKKERRQTEKEKDDPFDIDDTKLSEEVKKRLQMRKQMAEQLKNK